MSVVGARPNYMKIAPIASLLANDDRFDHVLVHTGQHYDDSMSRIFFEEVELGAPDYCSSSARVPTARRPRAR